MTFQRKLVLGFSLMVIPAVLVGAGAIRSNDLERRALRALGESMARTRTYAELETAMFNQSEVIWRYLSGLDPTARDEFRLTGQVVDYWQERWATELRPEEKGLAQEVREIQQEIQTAADSIFRLYDSGRRQAAFNTAQQELKGRLLPALTQLNRQIYRQARESSVRGAYSRLEEILAGQKQFLLIALILSLAGGFLGAWLIARSLARPLNDLAGAMAVVGTGQLDHPVKASSDDEVGALARAFGRMTENLRQSRSDMIRLNAELEAKVSQLERTQAQLVQSEKLASIGEMSAAVAHGLRNPLASLRAVAQLVQRHPNAASREQLSSMIEEVDRLERRISHLLSFSRPAPFHPLAESIPRLIEGLLPAFAEPIREHGIELQLDLPPTLPEVRVDPIQLEQALVEIVSNALDAMPNGGRLRVLASVDRQATRSSEVMLEITDSGPGIPEHVLPSVCEPFFTTREEGTGLGLAIAKRYIEQNGGRLEISSDSRGTTVRVGFPALARVEAAV